MKIAVQSSQPEVLEALRDSIVEAGHECVIVVDPLSAVRTGPALAFLEWMEGDGLARFISALYASLDAPKPVPVVVIVPAGALTMRNRMIEEGAADALFSPPDPDEIKAEIEEFCGETGFRDPLEQARFREIAGELLVGDSPNFRRCLDDLRRAARSAANILLVGETGTGKEMFAKALHRLSDRRSAPYVAVNCAAIPTDLPESELFGYVKGAFTGATRDRPGRFEIVGAGVLLLDEIGNMDLALQAKLLRAIEQRTFQRVGANTDIPFRGRLVCATSVDLDAAVAQGRFQMALLGRIDQFRITIPPLRDRRIDIPILAAHFLRKHAGPRRVEISRSAMDILQNFDFPMNVRQLDSAVQSALTVLDEGAVILPRHLTKDIASPREPAPSSNRPLITLPDDLSYDEARQYACRTVDRFFLGEYLRMSNNNLSQAAEAAGIDRKTFRSRLGDYLSAEGEKEDD